MPPDRAPQSFADIAAKLVDLRGVAKPPVFSGKETEWADFRFRLESIAALLGCDRLMKISADMKEEPLHAMMLQKEVDTPHFLYNLFVQICGGRSYRAAVPRHQRPASMAAADARVRAGHGKPVLRDALGAAHA